MNLLERVEVEVSRQARLVLLVRLGRRRRRPRFARLAQTPWFPRRAAEPRAVHQQTVSAAPVIPRAADSLRHRARRYVEGRGGRPVLHITVEPELILKRGLLKGCGLPAEIEPGGQRPRQQALAAGLAARSVQPIARRRSNREE